MVHIYNEYQQIREAEDGKIQETGNWHDLYAVKNDVVVGHVPQKILPLCSIFI